MRQLIARIDDSLHARLKRRARDDGRSVNALVTEILERGVPDESGSERLRSRLREAGLLAEIQAPPDAPAPDKVRAMLRGEAGRAVLDALAEDRADRA
jgi:plasmid stability protein